MDRVGKKRERERDGNRTRVAVLPQYSQAMAPRLTLCYSSHTSRTPCPDLHAHPRRPPSLSGRDARARQFPLAQPQLARVDIRLETIQCPPGKRHGPAGHCLSYVCLLSARITHSSKHSSRHHILSEMRPAGQSPRRGTLRRTLLRRLLPWRGHLLGQTRTTLVVDMHAFDKLAYDPVSGIAIVGSGVLLGTMNEFLESHGRMLPTGSCPTVGVGGQVLAGGFGLSSRSAGLFLDNLVEMDVVLADGTAHTLSEEHMADLYWVSSPPSVPLSLTRQGMRGAGASLAIAHTFRLRTHPAPPEVIYYELTLLPRSLDASSASIDRATRFYEAFEAFGGSALATAELGMFAWHVTPEQGPGRAQWGTKVEVLGQYMGDRAGFDSVMRGFERTLRDMGESNYHLGFRRLCKWNNVLSGLTSAFLESMHQVGGNWTRLVDRGPLNINEHVNFYAKVTPVLAFRRAPLTYRVC